MEYEWGWRSTSNILGLWPPEYRFYFVCDLQSRYRIDLVGWPVGQSLGPKEGSVLRVIYALFMYIKRVR